MSRIAAGPAEERHRSMAQSAAGPQRSGGGLRVRLEEPPVHGADHVLRDDALHRRPVTAAGWPFGMGLLLAGAMGTAEVTLNGDTVQSLKITAKTEAPAITFSSALQYFLACFFAAEAA